MQKTNTKNRNWIVIMSAVMILLLGLFFIFQYQEQKAEEVRMQEKKTNEAVLEFESDVRKKLSFKLLEKAKRDHENTYNVEDLTPTLENLFTEDESVKEAIKVVNQVQFSEYQKAYETQITTQVNKLDLVEKVATFTESCAPAYTKECGTPLIGKIVLDEVKDTQITVEGNVSPEQIEESVQIVSVYSQSDEVLQFLHDKRRTAFHGVMNFDEVSEFIGLLEFYYYVNTQDGNVPALEQRQIDQVRTVFMSQHNDIENFFSRKTNAEWSSEYEENCTTEASCNNWKDTVYEQFTTTVPSPKEVNTQTVQPFLKRFRSKAEEGQRLMDE